MVNNKQLHCRDSDERKQTHTHTPEKKEETLHTFDSYTLVIET